MSQWGALWGLAVGGGLLLVVLGVQRHRGRVARRLAPYLSGAGAEPVAVPGSLAGLGRAAATALHSVLGGTRSVARRLAAAGQEPDVEAFRLSQLAWAAAASGAAAGLLGLSLAAGRPVAPVRAVVLLLVAAAGGVVVRDWALDRAVRTRRDRIAAQLPAVADLLAFAVAAGEAPASALARVARTSGGELGAELQLALADVQAGVPLTVALEHLADRLDVRSVRRFVDGIVVALDRGTPLADVLRAQAGDARATAHQALLEAAGRRELAMLVPVVFLVLPCVVVIALFPGLSGLQVSVP